MDLSKFDEAWFSKQLEGEEVLLDEVLDIFSKMNQNERGEEAETWAQMLFQRFTERDDLDSALMVLEWLALNRGVEQPAESVKRLFSKDRSALKMIEPAGFGKKPLAEAFRRVRFLRALREGMLCYNATWGFGVIEDIDSFYQQIEVRFERKGEHELSFSYAAEALEILDDEHVLAIRHKRPEEIERLLKEDPAEIICLALKSYGPMPIARLQEMISPSIVPEAQWKKFWAGARAGLKKNPLVEIPKKRSENIILRKKAIAYDDEWFAQIQKTRDIEGLFELFKEIQEKKIDYSLEAAQEALANRLAFIIKGAPSAHPEWKAQGLLYSRIFDVEPTGVDTDQLIHQLVEGDLIRTLDQLPPRHLQPLLALLIEHDKESVIATLNQIIPEVAHSVLAEIIAALMSNGAEEELRRLMGSALARRTASASMLLWCQRSTDWLEKWNLISPSELAFRIQEVLELPLTGAMLRAQNQLRERFQQEEWLKEVMSEMTPQQRRDFLRRTNEGPGWDALDRNSVIAKVLRNFPELQDIITPTKGSAPARKEVPLTSTRSYVARQKQLEKIMTVEIPENSKEIELARSYGDLRENAEFKYAKERQGLLMAQGAQLAEDLEKVKPTDFSDVELDEVAMGTRVELSYADGTKETYCLLGVWDQDEALNIISSETRLAQTLLGHKAGDTVETPDGKSCEITAILPLPEEVQAWIREEVDA